VLGAEPFVFEMKKLLSGGGGRARWGERFGGVVKGLGEFGGGRGDEVRSVGEAVFADTLVEGRLAALEARRYLAAAARLLTLCALTALLALARTRAPTNSARLKGGERNAFFKINP
jgi:hypothetical protein